MPSPPPVIALARYRPPVRTRRTPRWSDLSLLLAALGVGLRLWQWSGPRPLWLDEEMIALNVRDRGYADLAGGLWLDQSAPLGWLWCERTALLLLGTGEQAMRLVPTLFGVGTVVVAWWAGRRWLGPAGSAVFVGLCALGHKLLFNGVELKPYTADAFWALLLPVLAGRALDGPPDRAERRLRWWWLVAAIGLWFGNGALFVAPATAAVALAALLRAQGWRTAARAALPTLGWGLSFCGHYLLALRFTMDNQALHRYWAFALPPRGASVPHWFGEQLPPLAADPAGTSFWRLLWLLVAVGVALAARRRPPLGLLLAAAPVTAFALAAARLVPLSGRLSLWIAPALYLAVAVVAEAAARLPRRVRTNTWPVVAAGTAATMAVALLVASLMVSVATFGEHSAWSRPAANNSLNDRDAVRWLMRQRRPGDIVVTTRFGLPAIWWYAGVSVAAPGRGAGVSVAAPGRGAGVSVAAPGRGAATPDGLPVVQVGAAAPCSPATAPDALRGSRRALVYLGFRFDDVPRDFDDRLLAGLGPVLTERRFARVGRALVVDLAARPAAASAPANCFALTPARRE